MPRFHVLLAEDNVLFGRLLQSALEQWGARVQLARTVQEATRSLESRRPDLMVLDEALPDGLADDVGRRARQLHDDQIPCIVLGHASPADVSPAARPDMSLGIDETLGATHMLKPIDVEAFQRQVAQTLGVRAASATRRYAPSSTHAGTSAARPSHGARAGVGR